MKVITRAAGSDFEALLTADAMESCGAQVFTVMIDGTRQHPVTDKEVPRYTVWARFSEDSTDYDKIDAAIDHALDRDNWETQS